MKSTTVVRWIVFLTCVVCIHSQNNIHEQCTTPTGLPGHCISIHSCTYLAQIFEPAPKPLTSEQVQTLHDYHCGFQGASPTPKVCCPHAPSSDTILQSTGASLEEAKIRLVNQNNCGRKVPSLSTYPWMALLAYNTSTGVSFKCGGSLINENYILTAAQCLTQDLVAVRLGEYDTATDVDCYTQKGCAPPVQDIAVSEVVRHRQYNPSTVDHDIALIRLSTPANVQSETIKPICLPLQDESTNLIGKYVDITGWGVTETGFVSSKLLKVSLPVLSRETCQQRYSEKNIQVFLQDGQICAGGVKGKDACSGDGGGPLGLQNERGVFVQHGIVSFGSRFCGMQKLDLPGVYTNVGKYFNWILNNIRA